MVLARLGLLIFLTGCLHDEFPSLYENVVERSRRVTPQWIDSEEKFVLGERTGFFVSKRTGAKDVKSALLQLEAYARLDLRRTLHRQVCPVETANSNPPDLVCANIAREFVDQFAKVEDIYFERIFAYGTKEYFYNLYLLLRFDSAGKADLTRMLGIQQALYSLRARSQNKKAPDRR